MLIKMEIKPRQLEIIEVAGKLITRSGINGLTIKNLANEMNFSEGAIYRHFKNKEEIILTLLRYLHENMRKIFEKTPPSGDFDKDLPTLFSKLARYFKENPYYVVAVFSEGLMDESEEINKQILQLVSTLMKHVKLVVEQGQEKQAVIGSVASEEIMQIIIPSFRYQMFKWKLSNFEADIEQEVIYLSLVFIELLRARS